MIWRCPRCRSELSVASAGLTCTGCQAAYPVVGGIPDFRLPGDNWMDYARDLEQARELEQRAGALDTEDLVRSVFASRAEWTPRQVDDRTRQVLEAPQRLASEVGGWLSPCLGGEPPFLDLGCGPGMLLAAAARAGRPGIGLDVSLTWLLVAQRLVRDWGGEPILAAGIAEALPLADCSVSGVVSLDVIEHVADPIPFLAEIDRVTTARGCVALSTPNRFSLAAEPHVHVWGVGWLPRRWQKRFVKWRSGQDYDFARLLSVWELSGLVRRHTRFRPTVLVPPVPRDEIERFPPHRAMLARMYNRVLASRLLEPLLRTVGPFFRILGTKA